jgi:hypothetical protein
VSFAAIILYVASQRVFILLFTSLSTQSGNFWIHPRVGGQELIKLAEQIEIPNKT